MVSANDVIDANVDASVVGRIKVGDPVVITTEGATGPVTGTVPSIGLTANTSSGVATFPVVINVTGTPIRPVRGGVGHRLDHLPPGPDVLAVPAAAVSPGAAGDRRGRDGRRHRVARTSPPGSPPAG